MVLKFLILVLPVLISVAFLTLLERKILSLVGLRVGPNKVSVFGFLQPMGDAVKLANKQLNVLSNFSFFFYYFSSAAVIFSGIFIWTCVYIEPSFISFKFSGLVMLLILALNSFNSVICGWSTFSKYSLIGSIRTVAQMISYESSLYFIFFFFFFFYLSFNFYSMSFNFLGSFFFYIPFCGLIWIPSFLAELNRTPYDFSEGESELVSGFNTEFGSKCFTLIFLAEYSNIMFFCMISSFLFFFGYYLLVFFIFLFFVIWIRSVLPRFRFDKLMMLCWKFYIPVLTCLFSIFSLSLY